MVLTNDGSDSSWTFFAVQFWPSSAEGALKNPDALIDIGVEAPVGEVETEAYRFKVAGNSIFPVDTFVNFGITDEPELLDNQRSIIFPLPEEADLASCVARSAF